MSRVFVQGLGAVSPAGWGVSGMRAALEKGIPLPVMPLQRPGWDRPLQARPVQAPLPRPAWASHPRLRRSSAISHYAVAAALEALGAEAPRVAAGELRLGVIVCVAAGCVAYSRRFYEEILVEPATASPLVFPETVLNAPASHLAACLGTSAINYTLLGDPGMMLQALAMAAAWLREERVEGCLVVGTEELDWIVADGLHLFAKGCIHSAGAGAVYLRQKDRGPGEVELTAVTDPFTFAAAGRTIEASRQMREQLPAGDRNEVLCDSTQNIQRADAAELAAWKDWSGERISPRRVLGQALAAAAAWQCVAACDALSRGQYTAANVSVTGPNQMAIGARFERSEN